MHMLAMNIGASYIRSILYLSKYIMHITMHMPVCITIYYTGSTELLTLP